MRKCLVILLMLVYGFSSSGTTVNLHYCCGKLDDISFSTQKNDRCPMGNHVKKSNCCHDKQITAKLIPDQEQSTKWIQSKQLLIATPVIQAASISFTESIVSVDRLARGVPVPITIVPLFIKNCVFRI